MNIRLRVLRIAAVPIGIAIVVLLGVLLARLFSPRPSGQPTEVGDHPVSVTPLVPTPPQGLESIAAQTVPLGRDVLSAANLEDLAELGHFGRGWPSSLDYSPDGSRLAVGSALGAEIFQTAGWTRESGYPSASPTLAVLFSPDGKWLATGQQDGTVLVLDAETMKVFRRLVAHSRPVHGLAFSGRDKAETAPSFLASGAEDGSVVVWEIESGMARHQFKNPLLGYWGYGIRSLAFSPDDAILVTGGDQGYLSRWELSSGEELPRLQTQHGLLFSIAFSPDGSRLASACGDGTVQIWDLAAEEPLALLQGHMYGAWSAAWSGDGKHLATGAGDGTVKIWEPEAGTLLREKAAAFTKIDILRYSPDDTRLAAVSAGESVFILDGESLAWIHSFPDFLGGLRSAAFFPTGEWAALTGENGITYLWNPIRGQVFPLGNARPASKADISAVFSPGGGTLAVADGLQGLLRLYDLTTLSPRSESRMTGMRTIAYSTDGKLLAAGGSGELILWDTTSETGTKIDVPSTLTSLAFPKIPGDEREYLAGGMEDGSVLVWDLDNIQAPVILATAGNPPVWSMAANGSMLAAGDDQGDVRVWDIADGSILRTYSGYSGSIFALTISPDRSLLVTGGIQGSLRFWSLENGKLLRVVSSHNGWVNGLAFAPDGRWLLSAGSDGTGRIWGVK